MYPVVAAAPMPRFSLTGATTTDPVIVRSSLRSLSAPPSRLQQVGDAGMLRDGALAPLSRPPRVSTGGEDCLSSHSVSDFDLRIEEQQMDDQGVQKHDEGGTGGSGGDLVLYSPPTQSLIRQACIKQLRREFDEVRHETVDFARGLLDRCRAAEEAELEAQQEAAELREQLLEAQAMCLILLESKLQPATHPGLKRTAAASDSTGATENTQSGRVANAVCAYFADRFLRCFAAPAHDPPAVSMLHDGGRLEALATSALDQCTRIEDEIARAERSRVGDGTLDLSSRRSRPTGHEDSTHLPP